MSLRIRPSEGVAPGLRRVGHEQIDKAVTEIEGDELDVHETAHKVRVRCKKLRALARLVRKSFDAYSEVNRALRDAARRVSDLRDAQAELQTLLAIRHDRERAGPLEDGALAVVEDALRTARERALREHEGALDLVRSDLLAVKGQVDDWELDDEGFDAIAGGLGKTFRRARDRMEDAYDDPSTGSFHEWRKRVKYHRYHVRMLQDLWPGPLDALRGELHDLTDALGDAHDRAELLDTVRELDVGEEPRRALAAFLDQERRELRERAQPLGERLFAETPDDFVTRVGAMWSAAERLGV